MEEIISMLVAEDEDGVVEAQDSSGYPVCVCDYEQCQCDE